VQLSKRGELISSFSAAFQKMLWFIEKVIPASVDRLLAIYSGNLFFKDKNLWHLLNVSEAQYKYYICAKYIFLSLIALPLANLIFFGKKKLYGVICILCIPGTYAVHLILVENGYHSHYAFALITILNFYFLCGLTLIIEKLFKDNLSIKVDCLKKAILLIGVLVITVQSLKYEIKFWVLENITTYSFIKNSVLNGVVAGAKRFHVFGVPNHANQPSVYSQFAVKLALREIGKDPKDYTVTVSETPFYIQTIQKNDFENALTFLDVIDRESLKSFYYYTETYAQYHIQHPLISKESLPVIQGLLKASKLLPNSPQETCIIDLRWKTSFWE
jgi:hypothetical protein